MQNGFISIKSKKDKKKVLIYLHIKKKSIPLQRQTKQMTNKRRKAMGYAYHPKGRRV